MGMSRERAQRLLLAACSSLISLMLLEAGCRMHAYLQDGRRQEAALTRPSRLKPGDPATLGQMVRASRSADIVYELRPDLNVRFMDRPVSTNSRGFRDREYPLEKPPGVARIVGLGDSVMFGWGVGDREDYLALLEDKLGDGALGARFEVINTAVPGYNGVMELATLKEKALSYRPALVIVGFCGNEMALPSFLQRRDDYLSLGRSVLLEFVRGRLKGSVADPDEEEEEDDDGGLVGRPAKVRWRDPSGEDLSRVPARYAHMVGFAAYDRTLKELRRLAGASGFELLVLYYPAAPLEVKRLVDSNAIESLSLAPNVRRFMLRHGGRERGRELLDLSPSDPHPSVEGHLLIAHVLFDHLSESGALARLAQRALTRQ